MIYVYFIALLALIIGGPLVYLFGYLVDELVLSMEATFPTIFTGDAWNVIKAILNWKLLFLVILPTIIFVYKNVQGPRE